MSNLPARHANSSPAASPFYALRDRFEQMFDDFTRDFPSSFSLDSAFLPSAEVQETNDGLEVTLELPGVDAEDVKLTVEDRLITITGEKKLSSEKRDDGSLRSERSYGSFTRMFSAPFPVNADKVEAHLDKGVLHIKVSKPDGYVGAARQIEIKH